jgi:hypothetical protein
MSHPLAATGSHDVWRGEYRISTDRQRLDMALIHEFLSRSYWSLGIPRGVVERGIDHSLCFGRGLGKWLVETIVGHRDLQGLRRFLLATRDAHSLYRQFGFNSLAEPARLMEIHRPDVYTKVS